jgi:hypothetical protein
MSFPTRSHLVFAAIVSAIALASAVRAQTVDFSVANVQILNEDADSFEVCYDIGHTNTANGPLAPVTVPLRISVQGPSTTVNDDQVIEFNYPADPHGPCTGAPACTVDAKKCPRWTVIITKGGDNERTARVQPTCANSAGTCRCAIADDYKAPPKPKPKHNGPGSYTVTVTIDNGNTITEINEANNSGVASTVGNTDACPNVPTMSEWGLVALTCLVLAAGSIVLRRRSNAMPT